MMSKEFIRVGYLYNCTKYSYAEKKEAVFLIKIKIY